MKISNELKIGFWAIVALAILFFGINYLKGIHSFKQGQFYYLSCDKVDGLAASSHIKLHGLKVGMVRSLEYEPTTDKIIVALNIYDSDIRIPRDSRVEVQTDLLGTSDVVLTMGESTQYYEPWDTIYAPEAVPGLLEKADPILGSVAALMPKIDSLVTGINVLVNDSKLHESLLGIHDLTVRLGQTTTELNRVISRDVPAVMRNVNQTALNLDTITSQVKAADVSRTLQGVNQTLNEVSSLITQIKSEESTTGRLMQSPELYEQLSRSVASLDSLLTDVKANPKRYIHIKVL